jgi:hypothetical protein
VASDKAVELFQRASAAEVIDFLTRRMKGCEVADILTYDPEGGWIGVDPAKLMRMPRGCLRRLYHDKQGRLQIELHDGLPAARVLAEYHGLVGSREPEDENERLALGVQVLRKILQTVPAKRLRELELAAIRTTREIEGG